MNDVGKLHASVGMTNLTSTSNADTPKNGNTYTSSWHLYWDASYSDDPSGSNAWVAQIVNKAGTDNWWVRSRAGGTITNGTAWASSWRHLVTSTEAAVGNGTQPVYVNANGEVVACTAYESASVSHAGTAAKFNSNRKISITGAVTGEGSSDGSNGWTINTSVNHTHDLSIAASSGTTAITLAPSTQYTLTAGGKTFIFTTPPNTTYTANNGVGLSGTTFYNTGVRSVATGSTNGTISVNTNGTAANVAVKGLAALAYKASLAYSELTGKPGNATQTADGFMSKEDKTKLDDMEVIIGTQDAKTGEWKGTSSKITSLYNGLTIKYYLNRDPSGDAFLTLTLADGTQTPRIRCYYNSGKLTTHYAVGSIITLTYFSAGSITVNGTATTDDRWIADANYDSGNTDTATRQKVRTTNANYSLLFADPVVGTADNNTAYYTYRNDSIYVNPSTGNVYAPTFNGSLVGNVTGNCSGTAGAVAWANITGKPSTFSPATHTHATSIATSSGTNQITLAANTKYSITAGGTSYVFTTPPDNNTWRGIQNNLTSDSTTDSLSAAQGKALKALVDGKAASGHTHATTIAADSANTQLALAANTKYKITAGGTSFIFTTPPDNNTWRGIQNNLTSDSTTDSLSAAQGKALKGLVDGKAASGHTHTLSIATDSGTNQLTLGASTKYKLTAGGSTYIFTTPPNTTYSAGAGMSLSGTSFINAGVRSVSTGGTNGTISVNTNGTAAEVAVKGLGSAAYTASTAYAASGHTHTLSMTTSTGTASIALAYGSKYQLTAGGSTYVFGMPAAPTWSQVTDKPATATRWPGWSEVTDKPATATRWPSWSEVTSKPSTFTPAAHTHTLTNITDFPAGGSTGQALVKNSATDYDVAWGAVGGIMRPDASTKYYVTGSSSTTENTDPAIFNTAIYVNGGILYGAAWNDYAEYRETKIEIQPGRCIVENGDGTLSLATARMQPGAEIVSDTYGFAIGQTEKCNTPIAVTGRVLAYPYEDISKFKPGRPVCSGPNGTVSLMTDEEARSYPWLIIGTVSAVPQEEIWGENDILTTGRIWIRIR